MAQRNIDFGTFPDDPDADAIRTAFSKVQQNFTELYSGLQTQAVRSINQTPGAGIIVNSPTGDVIISARFACLQVLSTSLNLSNGAAPSSYVIISSSTQPLTIDLPDVINTVTDITLSGTLTAAYLYGDGSNLTNLPTANNAANANYASFAGIAYSVAGGNVSGIVANANYAAFAGNVTNSAQPNITSVGTLANLVVTGNVTSASGYFLGDGGLLSNLAIPSGNAISDGTSNVIVSPSSNVTFSVSGNAQVATVTGDGIVLGNGNGGSLTGAYLVSANYLYGDGSNISNLSIPGGDKISNGTSNVAVLLNSNVTFGVNGTSNVVVVSDGGVFGTETKLDVAGLMTAGNLGIGFAPGDTITGYLTGNTVGAVVRGNNADLVLAVRDNEPSLRLSAYGSDLANVTQIDTQYGDLKVVPYGNLRLGAQGVDKMYVTTSGNVGIGTASPTDKLEVAGNIVANVAGYAIGYRDVPQVLLSANTTPNVLAAGKHFYSVSSSNLVFTIANNATQPMPTGAAIAIVCQGTGNVLVNQGTGVTMYMAGNSTAGNRVIGPYGMATIMKVATDTWFVIGAGVS